MDTSEERLTASARRTSVHARILAGQMIPAHPLALTARRTLDERRQRALTRYYMDAGAGGIAVGVHMTQFAIRERKRGLYEPVLALAADTARSNRAARADPMILVAGAIGDTRQAVAEAEVAASLGYDLVLLGLGAMPHASDEELVRHCRTVADVLPLFGFYLQPAVGGRVLSYRFWRLFAEIPAVKAIKIAPFSRYRTLDVVRAIADAGREDLALYTGNDDNILLDLLTPFPVGQADRHEVRHIVGGLLGQWAVWTRAAVSQFERVRSMRGGSIDEKVLEEAAALTDANAAIFDAANGFAGCIPGIHEILRRQGLLDGTRCLDPGETLSTGQSTEIDRICRRYPALQDDVFVRENLDRWMS